MNCKIHVNLSQGLFEAEGPEQFVLTAYKDFKDNLAANIEQHDKKPKVQTKSATPRKPTASKSNSTKTSVKKKPSSQSYSQVMDLNIYAEGDSPSLEEFLKGYNTSNAMQQLLLFTHYLKEVKTIEVVGRNELYTCYKRLGIKVPIIENGLHNTSQRTGWLDVSALDDIKITVAGENAVEHELAKNNEQK